MVEIGRDSPGRGGQRRGGGFGPRTPPRVLSLPHPSLRHPSSSHSPTCDAQTGLTSSGGESRRVSFGESDREHDPVERVNGLFASVVSTVKFKIGRTRLCVALQFICRSPGKEKCRFLIIAIKTIPMYITKKIGTVFQTKQLSNFGCRNFIDLKIKRF